MIGNRPGLSALEYRSGTRDSILAAMTARLSSADYPAAAALTTRQQDDPTIALLDAWATTEDVLTFYQERIADECYLRTATERRSIVELAGLVGYRVRPGVASSVHLAYQLDAGSPPVTIASGARSNSVPEPGETQQAFETSDDLEARPEWNDLAARITRAQTPQSVISAGLYLAGTATRLAPNDALLLDLGDGRPLRKARVASIEAQAEHDRTLIELAGWDGGAFSDPDVPPEAPEIPPSLRGNGGGDGVGGLRGEKGGGLLELLDDLRQPPSIPPASSRALGRSLGTVFGRGQDIYPALLTSLQPRFGDLLYAALRARRVSRPTPMAVYALRQRVSLFGHNAPREVRFSAGAIEPSREWTLAGDEAADRLFLDTTDEAVQRDEQLIIERPLDGDLAKMEALVEDVARAAGLSRSAYGLTGAQTMVEVRQPWWDPVTTGERVSDVPPATGAYLMESLRATTVYCRQEELPLAEAPIAADIRGAELELAALYDGLVSGRWIIVEGERTDVSGTSGVHAAELAMVAGVRQGTATMTLIEPDGTSVEDERPGETTHTFLSLAKPLAYTYRRDSVTIHGNVVPATNGESREEVLGSGVAGRVLQTFALKQPPLTHVSAATAEGEQSTLQVRVDEVLWHEADALGDLAPGQRGYVTATDDSGVTRVTFGTGTRGARLPSGQENVRARYRSGIGRPGDLAAGQISQLATRPLGVKAVVNPIRSSGGADPEGLESARENVPIALMAFDRLVSVEDYADFSRRFAGVGKASAARLSNGRQRVLQVTIAGAEDAPIEPTSDLYRNLSAALHSFGDPHLAIRVAVRELLAVVIAAKVKVLPDYDWELVEPHVRAALLDAFSFQRVQLGASIASSRVVQVIAGVPGVDWVDLDTFTSWSEQQIAESLAAPAPAPAPAPTPAPPPAVTQPPRRLAVLGDRADSDQLLPAQLALLLPTVADTLILSEVTS